MPRVAAKPAPIKRAPAPPPRNPRLIAERPSKHEIRRRQIAKLAGPISLCVAAAAVALLILLANASTNPNGVAGHMRESLAAAVSPDIQHIQILHQKQTPQALLDAAIGPARGTPILNYPLEITRERLLEIPWISAATVERRLPDTLLIDLTEHDAFAIWQNQGKFVLIDRTGKPLPDVDIANFKQLPLVVGEGAPAAAPELLDALAAQPGIQKLVKGSSWVGQRRWDLYLSNDTRVLLPQGAVVPALARLAQFEAQDKLFERPLAVIDMRQPDKMVLELRPAPAADTPPAKDSKDAKAEPQKSDVTKTSTAAKGAL